MGQTIAPMEGDVDASVQNKACKTFLRVTVEEKKRYIRSAMGNVWRSMIVKMCYIVGRKKAA